MEGGREIEGGGCDWLASRSVLLFIVRSEGGEVVIYPVCGEWWIDDGRKESLEEAWG